MKEFVTAVEEAERDDENVLEFKLDGEVLHAYPPTDGQIALTMAQLGRHTSDQTKTAGIIDFFVAVLDHDSATYITERLLSRDDPLGLPQVEEVMRWMVEEWTGRPTEPLSVSTPSRQSGGQKSRRTTRKSTSSVSAPASS